MGPYYKRPEKETDPIKLPGQTVNPITLADYIGEVEVREKCCHKTVITRCEGCPYATRNS